MNPLNPRERLQPSLLDRLVDDEPGNPVDSSTSRLLSMNQLKASVLRDLSWLLNATSLLDAAATKQMEAGTSVINFGLPPLAGHSVSSIDGHVIEALIRQAIIAYEPRILPTSLQVRAHTSVRMNVNALNFEIEGDLWAQPVPLPLLLHTELDLETGHMQVVPAGQRRRL